MRISLLVIIRRDFLIFSIKHVDKVFGSKERAVTALSDVSFLTPEKGLFAIMGKSGSGKSTLLNLLSLLETPSKGKIIFRGRNLSKLSEREKLSFRNRVCGFVHQKFNLLEEETVFYNVALPLLIRGEKKAKIEKKVGDLLSKFALSKFKNRKVSFLSGGEKQRVAIIRSIINNPKVVFADEPTGALDEGNSVKVMETLKEIGKDKLVILVTHNEKLAKQYADALLILKDGKIIENTSTETNLKKEKFLFPRFSSHAGWRKELFKSHLAKDKKKNFLSFLSSSVAFVFLLCSIGFIFGSNDTLNEEKEKLMLLYKGQVSNRETYTLENSPLSLLKSTRPEKEDLFDLFDDQVSVHNDYSYFYPSVVPFTFGDDSYSAYFESIFDPTLQEFGDNLLLEGEPFEQDDFSRCFVNDAFKKEFGIDVGDFIHVPIETNVTVDGANHLAKLSNDFVVSGVIFEFGFLNSPRIYYSYLASEERLREQKLPESETSLFDLVENANEDEILSSYSYLLFAHDEEGKKRMFSLAESSEEGGDGLSFSSYAYSLIASFSSLHSALGDVLVPFLILGLFASIFNSGAIAFSSFLERKKEAAILTSLGAPFSSIIALYAYESVFIALLSISFSLVVSFFLESPLNSLLYSLSSIPSLIEIPFVSFLGIPYLLPILAFLLSSLLSIFGTVLPMAFFKRSSLLQELNDE